jgi:hypothetical protein
MKYSIIIFKSRAIIYVVDVLSKYGASTSAYIEHTNEPSIVMTSPSKSFQKDYYNFFNNFTRYIFNNDVGRS